MELLPDDLAILSVSCTKSNKYNIFTQTQDILDCRLEFTLLSYKVDRLVKLGLIHKISTCCYQTSEIGIVELRKNIKNLNKVVNSLQYMVP